MKKILIVLACCLLVGCAPKSDVTSAQMAIYNSYVKQIKSTKKFYNYSKDFKAQVIYTDLGKYYSYDLIISKPKKAMYDITALSYSPAIHDSYHPSIGIFDQQSYHMVPGYVNKKKGYVKGFDLSGRVSKKTDIIVKISYYTSKNKSERTSHIIKVKA